MSLAVGWAASWLLTSEVIFSRTALISDFNHRIVKREIQLANWENATTFAYQPTTRFVRNDKNHQSCGLFRPSSAVGIDEIWDTKTKEAKSKQTAIVKCANEL